MILFDRRRLILDHAPGDYGEKSVFNLPGTKAYPIQSRGNIRVREDKTCDFDGVIPQEFALAGTWRDAIAVFLYIDIAFVVNNKGYFFIFRKVELAEYNRRNLYQTGFIETNFGFWRMDGFYLHRILK